MAIGFSIPGNIKQKMLPFVIDPNQELNKPETDVGKSNKAGNAIPQWFTYKEITESPNSMKLQMWPSTLTDKRFGNYFKKDVSYKLVYGPEYQEKLDVQTLIDLIPSVQIREYLPDTKFDQLTNLFTDLFSAITDAVSNVSLVQLGKILISGTEYAKRLAVKLGEILEAGYRFVVGDDTGDSFLYKAGQLRDLFTDGNGADKAAQDLYAKLVSFPFAMYYKLQSYTTTNIYEIPAMLSDKTLYSSTGKQGWEGGKGVGLATLFDKDSFLRKIPVLGKIIENVVSNVKVSWMPLWDADKGDRCQHPGVTIEFDLINDTDEAAAANIIFVNTLVPNNMFVQYGMFQHSSSIYDVRIEGFDRMFACSGNMSVSQLGVMRMPNWVWAWGFLKAHYNWDGRGGGFPTVDEFFSKVCQEGILKIPDAYHVKMEFESLLPNGFNSYLFNYLKNDKMQTLYAKPGNVWTGSLFSEGFFTELKNDFTGKLNEAAQNLNNEAKAIEMEIDNKAKNKDKDKDKK